ncbi:uncharacterized protein LOC133785895 [Humulus lupulus]|uniref:uncharacterized protein LOC133785895 n=1 Tax=Humulus lupulus TaxID=3486 RepID=UPI002B409A45|nr:uncharacterized protein LOC133785895 [Humulus lupulus]
MLSYHQEEASIIGFSANHIDLLTKVDGMDQWHLTGFYGEPNRLERQKSWDLIRSFGAISLVSWCILGDFNNVLSNDDKRGEILYPNWLLESFQQVIFYFELVDLDLKGCPFTWERGNGTKNWIEVRLGHAFVSLAWLSLFQEVQLSNPAYSSSDHCPILVEHTRRPFDHVTHSFRFENAWLRGPLCGQIISSVWDAFADKNSNGKLKKRKETISKLKNRCDADSIQRYKAIENKFMETLYQKEIFWRQRSKQLWLKAGDLNSKYFHATASARKQQNNIKKIAKG